MVSKKTAFLYLFLIIAHDFRQTKAFVIDREIIKECITILFAMVGAYITVYKTLYFLASHFLTHKQNSTNNTLDTPDNQITLPDSFELQTILKEQLLHALNKHYGKNVLFLFIKGNPMEVFCYIEAFRKCLADNKRSINYKVFFQTKHCKKVSDLVKAPLARTEIDLFFIPIFLNTKNHEPKIVITTQRNCLDYFEKKYHTTLLSFLNNPEELKPLEMLLNNYKEYDIFSKSPQERAFQIVCVNQETHDKQFIKCLKQYITAHLALVPCGDDAKKALCINADSLKSYALYHYPNSIFLVLDNVNNIELNTISYKSLKPEPEQDFT